MIFQGQQRPKDVFNDEEADGYYVEGGWYIPSTNFEIDLRYDTYTRRENPSPSVTDETTANTVTFGGQYHINKKTRINAEYAVRDFESDVAGVNTQLEGVADRFAIQVTHIF